MLHTSDVHTVCDNIIGGRYHGVGARREAVGEETLASAREET